jgi:hypothetical protein
MILTFFFAYEDEEKCVTVEDHKTIAIRYLKSWFIFDLLSIFPFDVILKAAMKSPKFSTVNTLIRISRIGKIYKLSRFLRLSKLAWLYRNRKKAFRNIDEKTKLSLGTERFLFFGASTLLLIHLSTCLWLFCTQYNSELNWLSLKITGLEGNGEKINSDIKAYFVSMYFICQTITTVGYGDYGPTNSLERIFIIFLMLIGSIGFAFMAGGISSIL